MKKKKKDKIVSFSVKEKLAGDDEMYDKIKEQLIKDADEIEEEINKRADLDQVGMSPDLFEKIKKDLKQRNLWKKDI